MYQVQTSEYHAEGKFIVIDQGTNDIAGYTNREDKVCHQFPCIIFGDHTTNIKYVNEPFVVGADGVKTLKATGDCAFASYNLKVNNVTQQGYKRHFSQLKEINVLCPSLSEQQKIGAFFCKLDGLINLHQRQTQKLTELKQGLLHEMFPQEGESVPRLRFPGFTTHWEQHKVQDIYKITRGYVLAAPETNKNPSDDMPYPVYSSQTKNNGLMGYYKDYLYEDAITWTTDGANAGTVHYRAGRFYCTNVCGVLLSEEGYANKCAAEALNNVAWRWVSHVGNPKLMNNVMGEIPICLPVSIEEQNQISMFLEEIDNLIGLHEQYVTTLRHLKKGLLQKMFPQD